jgi:hypothetical protein
MLLQGLCSRKINDVVNIFFSVIVEGKRAKGGNRAK